ncbi:MAG: bifunctional riboflavin kinase/FAD synthetase [Dehalococcoidia bacterium]|nr:bifunctional riboflavin kinase/FAD synthetase [Dehalococcoidia bacterium]
MKAFEEIERARTTSGSVLTIGTFDGVHRGHRHIISRVAQEARDNGLQAGVLTFTTTPREVFQPDAPITNLSSLDERIALLKEAGADYVVPVTFDRDLAGVSARDFAQKLVDDLSMRRLVVGPDFAMGRRREGTIPVLTEIGTELEFNVLPMDELQDEGQRIGSSVIRHLLIEDGNVAVANDMLARPYSLSGTVQEGHKRGKDLGFPTANISVPARRAVPADGIYVTRAHLGDRVLESVTNIGDNPTFHDQERMIETFILDFDEDLYGQTISVEFLERLRGEVEFTTVEALVEQMHLDVQQTRAYFAQNP